MRKRRLEAGFSLIELLMVAALMMIIAGMTLPSLIRSKIAGNEASAVSSLRVLFDAQARYSGTYNNSYSADLNSLGPPPAGTAPSDTAADLVDQVLSAKAAGKPMQFIKAGYQFTYVPSGAYPSITKYVLAADPISRGSTGQRSFWMDQTGIIRYNASNVANSSDTPLM